jgi:hypothetical protein
LFTVVERREISSELGEAAERWLARNGIEDEVDETWLALVCEDGEDFTPEKGMLHLAVPPCEISPGDALDVSRAQTVGERWPDEGAPEGDVPRVLVLARQIERDGDNWVAACRLPPPIRDLFTVERPAAMLAVMNATRRTLGSGALSISGDPGGRLSFTLVNGGLLARGSTEAEVHEEFSYRMAAGPSQVLAGPLQDATRVVGGLGARPDLIISNDQGVEARCLLDDDDQPAPAPLPDDHFENHAHGTVEGLRVNRPGGLGREALAAIAELRPAEVTLTAGGDGSLLIGAGPDDSDPFRLDGPGIAALADRPGVPIVVPYVVALAMYDGALAGTVELDVDARWGRLRRADQGITVEWAR